ncbi:MAG TPA: PAS domain S-box protein [Mucilaginibacter sp.]|jgi:two-component system CheB/CheR fusion protein|nr:PAS domain S-box protein [Mucilaginibacter sp.]
MEITKTYQQLLAENEELSSQLDEAKETIEAIRNGKIDAIVVNGEKGHRIYTLETADQAFRIFIEKMNEGAVTLNREGIIIYSNTKFASMVKMPLQKVMGLLFSTFIPEESLEKFRVMIELAWEKDCKEEFYIKTPAGEKICCLLSCNVIEMADGPSLSLIITDLTRQKKIQGQLQQQNEELKTAREKVARMNDVLEATIRERTSDLLISREHFKLLADHIAPMTWTNLPDGSFNYFNRRWYEYTGLDPEESIRSGWKAVIHPDDYDKTLAKFNGALETGQVFEMENRYRRKDDGVYRWYINRSLPLRNDDGEIIFWVGTATDIDDQKRELERKDEFIGVASHELKTPLTSLKGYLQLMTVHAKDVLQPQSKTYLDKANNSIHKLQHLVDDLLDVSKINAGKLNYAQEPVNLADIVASCMENALNIYPSFEFIVENELELKVKGNAERLEQVMMNFLSNAVKYSKDDKRIIVKTSRNDGWGRVSVTDFGIGLSKEQQPRIFDRFYRVDDRKYMTGGLGMGLYISAQIISTHVGTIGVESEFGKGSTFHFDLQLLN